MHDLRFLSAFLFLLEIAGCIHNLHQPPSVSLFSTLCSLPSFCSLHLLFSLLAIWLLQLCSLAYCRLCRCHQKLFTFQRFDAISHVHKTTPSTFCAASQTKRDGVGWGVGGGLLSLTARRPLVGCFLTSSSPQLHHQSLQPKVSDTVMATDGVFLPSQGFK